MLLRQLRAVFLFLFADDFYWKKANGHENTGFIIVVKGTFINSLEFWSSQVWSVTLYGVSQNRQPPDVKQPL
jgi:hypothetical protein